MRGPDEAGEEGARRLARLEMRLTEQEASLEDLNATILEQWRRIDALTRQVAGLTERIEAAETRAPGTPGERPPHY